MASPVNEWRKPLRQLPSELNWTGHGPQSSSFQLRRGARCEQRLRVASSVLDHDGSLQHLALSELRDAERVEMVVSQLRQSLSVDHRRRERGTVLGHA